MRKISLHTAIGEIADAIGSMTEFEIKELYKKYCLKSGDKVSNVNVIYTRTGTPIRIKKYLKIKYKGE